VPMPLKKPSITSPSLDCPYDNKDFFQVSECVDPHIWILKAFGDYSAGVVLLFLSPLNLSFTVSIFSVANNRDAAYMMTSVKAAT